MSWTLRVAMYCLGLLSLAWMSGDLLAQAPGSVSAASVPGLPSSQTQLPDPPDSRILDNSRVFNEVSYGQLSEVLKDFMTQYRTSIYIVTEPFMPTDEDGEAFADELAEHWRLGPTLVVLYVRSGHAYLAGDVLEPGSDGSDRRDRLHKAMKQAAADVRRTTADANLERVALPMSKAMVDTIQAFMEENKHVAPWWEGQKLAIGAGLLAAILVGGLVFIFGHRSALQMTSIKQQTFIFPTVHVEPRFGANSGGGTMAQREFLS
jgi:hypothetical protein